MDGALNSRGWPAQGCRLQSRSVLKQPPAEYKGAVARPTDSQSGERRRPRRRRLWWVDPVHVLVSSLLFRVGVVVVLPAADSPFASVRNSHSRPHLRRGIAAGQVSQGKARFFFFFFFFLPSCVSRRLRLSSRFRR